MNKIIGLIGVFTTILLFATKSLYVESIEIYIIIASLSVISIIFNMKLTKYRDMLGCSSIIGFFFFWVFGVIDLTVDHFMYYLPTGNEDGMALTLEMKIDEYGDNLLFASFISMMSVLTISILASLFLKLTTKNHKADIKVE